MIIAVTPYELLHRHHQQRLILIEPYIDGVILRTPTESDDLKIWVTTLINKGFPKSKIIIHSNVQCAEQLGIRRIHFREYEWPTAFRVEEWEVSMSVHSEKGIEFAKAQGAKFGLYGHLFNTSSKPNQPPRTVSEVRQALNCHFPLVAIGGINDTTVAEIPSKFSGIAMIGSVFHQNLDEFKYIVQQWHEKGGEGCECRN
ncbi:thiamine phosphate synthase [Staphylococcus chromogenes]|uniref:thiamine phosphate synthase n=1 Tax=Staphylococcus chromogenes TaxID=46126 RepID=UPI001E393AA7|nr:thiamine phosphate synthase [Staphylococcus chromogenes]MCD8904544.1 thiamine phosphate synthase [Staphylococcus chromogenes]